MYTGKSLHSSRERNACDTHIVEIKAVIGIVYMIEKYYVFILFSGNYIIWFQPDLFFFWALRLTVYNMYCVQYNTRLNNNNCYRFSTNLDNQKNVCFVTKKKFQNTTFVRTNSAKFYIVFILKK